MPPTSPLLALLPLLAPQGVNTSGGELRSDQAGWDVLHYDLELRVQPEERSIEGMLTMRARALVDIESDDFIALNLSQDFWVASADLWVGQRDPEDDTTPGREHIEGLLHLFWVEVPAGSEFTVQVRYGGKPREAPNPPWKGGFTWSQTADGRPWIATSCQGEGADLWWPCKDHPSDKPESMDIRVSVPDGLFCASNGVLVSDETTPGSQLQASGRSWSDYSDDPWRTLHWRVSQPIANYAVALNIAPYEVLEREFTSVDGTRFPVAFWYLPENADQAQAALPEFLDHLRHLESVCGPYPFRAEKYGLVETPHLGMEHQTIIAYGNRYRGGPDGFDWLHHHELSHEWWGNLVTCRDWKDMWLHEGFATYMQALYAEERDGTEGLQRFMRRARAQLGNRRPVAPRETMDSQRIYFGTRGESDSDIYYKGAWVLHTLRWQLGDETFFELLRRFAYPDEAHREATDGSQERFVDTEDLRALAEELHGRGLEWFFELYLRQPALPELEVERDGDLLELAWKAPAGLACRLDLPLSVDGQPLRVPVDEHGRARLPVTGKVEIDPDAWLLMR